MVESLGVATRSAEMEHHLPFTQNWSFIYWPIMQWKLGNLTFAHYTQCIHNVKGSRDLEINSFAIRLYTNQIIINRHHTNYFVVREGSMLCCVNVYRILSQGFPVDSIDLINKTHVCRRLLLPGGLLHFVWEPASLLLWGHIFLICNVSPRENVVWLRQKPLPC